MLARQEHYLFCVPGKVSKLQVDKTKVVERLSSLITADGTVILLSTLGPIHSVRQLHELSITWSSPELHYITFPKMTNYDKVKILVVGDSGERPSCVL
jgi:hypothetical protein